MADYVTIAVIHILVGFEIATLGFLNTGSGNETVEALMIIGFLVYLVAVILTVLMKTGDLAGNIIAMVMTLVMVLVAAVLLIAGAAIWYDHVCPGGASGCGSGLEEYTMTLDISGACMAAIGGIFLIVQLVKGGGKA